ncbi:MAG: DUF4249 domain-containing protein [Bacteroidota bacterium]|nr:DUF4249 domain-containing protein [Bacteroidota bacterium]
MKKPVLKSYIIALQMTVALASCTKVIDLKLRDNTGKLVIEGNITNKRDPQYIKLSQNVAFTSTNTYPPVTGAAVSVRDNSGNTFPFVEGPAGTYAINLKGSPGKIYTMNVKANGTIYTADSQMPKVVALDSITEKEDAFNKGNKHRQIAVHFQDPPGVANQYRFILTLNGVQVNRIFAFSDEFFDGRNVSLDLFQNDVDILPGDTVIVEMQCLDKPIYTYWFTLMQQGNGPGGGVSPSNPPTNIAPAALGYFSVHTTQTLTLKVR